IPNGIDLSRFHPDDKARAEFRAELKIPLDAFVVGTVGRLWPEKNQSMLIRSLKNQIPLLIAGDGPERPNLQAMAGSQVYLLGNRRDTPRLYAALDVFALSSTTEGLPLVLLEALASGVPVVSNNVGGIPHVITSDV